jgi:hypothetical protein
MRVLLAVIFLIMAAPAMALDCPDDSFSLKWDEGDEFAFSYTCDNNTTNYGISHSQDASTETKIKILKAVLELDDTLLIEQLVEQITGRKCIQKNHPVTGEFQVLHCR